MDRFRLMTCPLSHSTKYPSNLYLCFFLPIIFSRMEVFRITLLPATSDITFLSYTTLRGAFFPLFPLNSLSMISWAYENGAYWPWVPWNKSTDTCSSSPTASRYRSYRTNLLKIKPFFFLNSIIASSRISPLTYPRCRLANSTAAMAPDPWP